MRRVFVAFAIAASAAACALLTPLDDLGGHDGAATDAGFDATSDASDAADDVGDGGEVGDTLVPDAPSNGPACSAVDAAFCDDFDDSDGGTFLRWTSTSTLHGGTVARAPSDASAPFGAQFQSTTSDAGTPVAVLKKVFSVAIGQSASLAFDLRVDHWPSPSNAGLNAMQLNLASGPTTVSLRLRASNSELEETVVTDAGNVFPTQALTTSPALGKWVHVEIDLSLSQGKVVATVLFDGSVVLAPATLDPSITFGVPTLFVGEVFVDPGDQTSSMLVDDVVFSY